MRYIIYLLILLGIGTSAQSTEIIKASGIFWFGFEGYSQSDANSMYMLMGSGFFAAERDPSAEQLTNGWIKDHPNATVTIVNEISEDNDPNQTEAGKPIRAMRYSWVQDGNDCLNIFLVRNGCCPGGVMIDAKEMTDQWKEHGHDHSEIPVIKRLVSNREYDSFIKKVKAAELHAKKDKLGIYGKIDREIPDPNQFVKDCHRLIAAFNSEERILGTEKGRFPGGIDKSRWPGSISAIHPRAVFVRDNFVSILMSTGGIRPYSVGYMVFKNPPDTSNCPEVAWEYAFKWESRYLKESKYPGVYMYQSSKY